MEVTPELLVAIVQGFVDAIPLATVLTVTIMLLVLPLWIGMRHLCSISILYFVSGLPVGLVAWGAFSSTTGIIFGLSFAGLGVLLFILGLFLDKPLKEEEVIKEVTQ